MTQLPVIVGIGGINPAGRSSSHHAYRRLVLEQLPQSAARETLANLAVLMDKLPTHCAKDQAARDVWLLQARDEILAGTLIRKLEKHLFDHENLRYHINTTLTPGAEGLNFIMPTRDLPVAIPPNWQLATVPENSKMTRVEVHGPLDALLGDVRRGSVQSAGQLPSGFDPQKLYASRNHPRGLQMTIFGVSDALDSLGIDWETIRRQVSPDQIAVYAGSSMSQLDYNGNGGMLQARLLGKQVTSKQLPLGFAEMPADFINAYVLGSVGLTGANLGACASFHYNLRQAIQDIRGGTCRVAIVGGSEAPLLPEVMEGYANMGALADDAKLLALDAHKNLKEPDFRRACRPFGQNVGFTLGESAQFVVLFDDQLALSLGANILGAVNDVFVNADGYKKSISSPGIGNYITMAKATAATRAVIGAEGLARRTLLQAHGTSTPQNRVTESAIFSRIATEFGIDHWPVTAIKAYVGHSLCCAGADQLASTLGIWEYGIIPGIVTTEAIAEDVHQERLDFLLSHKETGPEGIDAALLNAKGFGGNNATASILAPHVVKRMLEKRHGRDILKRWQANNEKVKESSSAYNQQTCNEMVSPTYRFDHDVREEHDLQISDLDLKIRGYETAIDLNLASPYQDMID